MDQKIIILIVIVVCCSSISLSIASGVFLTQSTATTTAAPAASSSSSDSYYDSYYDAATTTPDSKTYWDCMLDNNIKSKQLGIWWGHTSGDASWACNEWVKECDKKCIAKKTSAPISSSKKPDSSGKTYWDCMLDNDIKSKQLGIWWGHTSGDASWACNEWVKECDKKCIAK